MKKIMLPFLLLLLSVPLLAQLRHLDYIGAGHDNLVAVTASSSSSSSEHSTVDGFPIQNTAQLKDASRFLAQATFGADYSTIQMTAAMGYEAWLDEQFMLPQISYLQEMYLHGGLYGETGGSMEEPVWRDFFRTSWMTINLSSPDLLRQRMAFNWSQIMVINDKSDFFEDVGQILAAYYDMLQTNSFGNYEQLLKDVTLSPAMGIFLSHYNNPKANPAENIHPDENYAREIMQLFSIGLWELNPNGTRKTDSNGQFIPTYNNADIKEFAQVFTGLGNGRPSGVFGASVNELEESAGLIMITPMKMYDDFHDTSEKQLLNGLVLPANQPGMTDVDQTIAHLVNHPNTAPFIAKSLIKMFTTSNPSVVYVQDVANTFNPSEPNNLQEVIRAILLHPDARNCTIEESYTFGKLREPVVRLMNFMKAFQLQPQQYFDFEYSMGCYGNNTGQSPLAAPSVFNFFLPDYQPPGPIAQSYLIAPEFQIFNSTNAIGAINDVDYRVIQQQYLNDVCVGEGDEGEYDSEYFMDFSTELALTNDPAALVNHLDILLANGLLRSATKSIITNAVSQLEAAEDRLRMAIYLILIAPDYAILK